MATDISQKEAEILIRKAQAQPGIPELMMTYGRYEEVMEQTRAYMDCNKYIPKSVINTNSSLR